MRNSGPRSPLGRLIALATAALLPAVLLMSGTAAHATTVSAKAGAGTAASGPAAAGLKVVASGLAAISCKGKSFCMAAGTFSTSKAKGLRLVEAWNGKSWHDVRDPLNGELGVISCGGPSFCFGSRPAGAAQWDGKTWKAYANNLARGATCGSPKLCMAVSGVQIARWNGKSWKADPSTDACAGGPPDNADCGYDTLSCGSASTCLALYFSCSTEDCGDGPDEFANAWDGTSWGNAFGPPDQRGSDLSCSWGEFCLLTYWPSAQATIWDSAGFQDASPDLSTICTSAENCSLRGPLSCGAPQKCVVLPTGSPDALVWSDFAWKAVPLATIGGQAPTLSALSCGSGTSCMAVGRYRNHSVAERWNGKTWQLTTPTNH
jgi:hypothetical protein